MLIEYSVKNYKPFKNKVSLSMEATADNKHMNNLYFDDKNKLLKSTIIYGANASGKTKIIESMNLCKNFIMMSHAHQINTPLNHMPFAFDERCKNEPTLFEVKFIHENIKYEYSFSYDQKKIVSESLIHYPNGRRATLFTRNYQNFTFNKDKHIQEYNSKRVRENVLYISVSAQFNYEVSKKVVDWFTHKMAILIGHDVDFFMGAIINEMNKDPIFRKKMFEAIKIADFGITDIEDVSKKKLPVNNFMLNSGLPQFSMPFMPDIWFSHEIINNDKKSNVKLSIYNESAGTVDFISLIGTAIKSLSQGVTLIVDEMDVNLHTELSKWIISLYHDSENNTENGQLIFNTHDVELQNLEIFRRDQIWFTEKDWKSGESILKSLSDYKERNDRDIRKGYLAGRYGAKPFINSKGLK